MASNDLFLRSDVDKGETSPDKDLRLRSDTDKIPAAAGGQPTTIRTQGVPTGPGSRNRPGGWN